MWSGLGANALSGEACKKIFAAKNRPADNPLIAHISDMDMLSMLVADGRVPPQVKDFLDRSQLWPGPLTLLFPASVCTPDCVSVSVCICFVSVFVSVHVTP